MITYINNETEVYYDFNMINHILNIHPSHLKREMGKYGFTKDQYIKYKNRHLYTLNSVTDFIVFIIKNKVTKNRDHERAI